MPPLERSPGRSATRRRQFQPRLEVLEDRTVLSVTATLSGAGVLTVNGDPDALNHIFLILNKGQIEVSDGGQVRGSFASTAVASIIVNANGTRNVVRVDPAIAQPATLNGGPGNNYLVAGGGDTTLSSGTGTNRLVGGNGDDIMNAQQGTTTAEDGNALTTVNLAPRATSINTGILGNLKPPAGSPLVNAPDPAFLLGFKDRMTVNGLDPAVDHDLRGLVTPPDFSATLGIPPSPDLTISAQEVGALLNRAAAATSFDSAIVAVVDRNGRILGVRVEGGVSPAITGNTQNLVFAIDGAVAEARTGAFFANDTAPLTSRTIQFISQSTNTQRMVESNPSITDVNSTLAGPGTVGPIEIGGNFPPGIMNTPLVDLFNIEETNRDSTNHPVYDANGNVIGFTPLAQRFNINPAFIPANQPLLPNLAGVNNQILATPNSFGTATGLEPNAIGRGIGTLPGGIPIFKNGVLVGGIGVFFPGTTGFADAENSSLSSNFDPTKIDLSLVAEYTAFAAVGGSTMAGFKIGSLGGVAALPGFDLPFGQINLNGIQLPLFGPTGADGTEKLVDFGLSLGTGNANSGANQAVNTGGATLLAGLPAPEGFLVTPHAGTSLTAGQVQQIIVQAVRQAQTTRAQIRLPLDNTARMVISVADPKTGEILGLFRMPDSTIFSIDVAVAKSRNNSYYADPTQLQAIDQTPGVAPGVAFSSRTFRFLADPFFPEGITGSPPAPFSILNVPGTNLGNGLNTVPPLPKSAYFTNIVGHDVFYPQTNFHDPNNPLNQDGIVFFPGGVPLYGNSKLTGGLGVSGDGVDEDDVVTAAGAIGFAPPTSVLTADQVFVSGVRLPYQLFNRNPTNLTAE
jgi:uncharacterized protein GlcG (DUF336 family)